MTDHTAIQETNEMKQQWAKHIEQAEKQEPVAWMVRDSIDGSWYPCAFENPSGTIAKLSEPLYTAPPRKEWVGLTTDEIFKEAWKGRNHSDFARGAEWAEAKLKEKNGG